MDMQDSMKDVLLTVKDESTRRVLILLTDLLESVNQRVTILENQVSRHEDTLRGPVQQKSPKGGDSGLSIG